MKKKILANIIGLILLALIILLILIPKSNIYYDEKGNSYDYKLQLTGTMPNSNIERTITVLTNNKKLTFNDVSEVLLNSAYCNVMDFVILQDE